MARQRFNRAVLIGPIIFIIGAIAFSTVMVARESQRAIGRATLAPPQSTPETSASPRPESAKTNPDTWATGLPLVTDVDGDGNDDLIGLTRNVQDGDRAQVGAFSGVAGAPLWHSERLGTYSETVQAGLYLAGDAVLITTPGGELSCAVWGASMVGLAGARPWVNVSRSSVRSDQKLTLCSSAPTTVVRTR